MKELLVEVGRMRHIGIIGDGETDYRVFEKIVKTLLSDEVEVVWLRKQTLQGVGKYWKCLKNSDSKKCCGDLQKTVKGILQKACSDFASEIKEDLTCKDIILLTTDAEKHLACLNNEQIYWDFNGNYFGILHCLMNAIRDFYRIKYQQGSSPKYMPMIIPVVTFPSIEPFLLIAKGEPIHKINGKEPNDLKKILYKTNNPSGTQIENAIGEIQDNRVYEILKTIPESRFFIQTLLTLGV